MALSSYWVCTTLNTRLLHQDEPQNQLWSSTQGVKPSFLCIPNYPASFTIWISSSTCIYIHAQPPSDPKAHSLNRVLSLGTAWLCVCKYFRAQRADSSYWLQNKSHYKDWVFWTPLLNLRNPRGTKHFYSRGCTKVNSLIYFTLPKSFSQLKLTRGLSAPADASTREMCHRKTPRSLPSLCRHWDGRRSDLQLPTVTSEDPVLLGDPERTIFPVFLGSAHSTILIFYKHHFVLYQFDFSCNRGCFYGPRSYWKWENRYI